MKPTSWVPLLIAAESAVGMIICAAKGDRSSAIYWAGAVILNVGLAYR